MRSRRNRVGGFEEEEIGAILARCRSAAAALLGAAADEITLSPNTSFGVNLGAALAAAGEPGTVVLSDGEFPANVRPWQALSDRGFRVEVVPADALGRPDEPRLMERLDAGDARVFALSAVQFATGHRADLEAFGGICRRNDILFVVDAIQALGAVPVHPAEIGVDLLATGGQKWLCAPWGSGFTWIAPRHRDRFDPPMVSWLAMESALDFGDLLDYGGGFLEDGRKFELATLGIQDHLGLACAIELFLEMDPVRIEAHLRRLHAPVLDWIDGRSDVTLVTPRAERSRAGILAFRPPEVDAVAARLTEQGVVLAVRQGALRLAPHFYNSVDEMERVVEMLDEAVQP